MSEPRKLYTGSATGGQDQQQYEAARRRAQQLAEQNARRRTVQQPMRTAQGRHISQRPAVPPQPAPEPVQEAPAQPQAPAQEAPRELTYAQRQAMAYRAATERKYGDTLQFQVQRPHRTVNRPPEPEQRARQAAAQLYEQPAAPRQVQQPAPRPQAQAPVQQAAPGAPAPVGGIRLEEAAAQPRRAKHADAPQPAAHKPRTAAGGNGGSRKPPRDDDAPRKAKGRKSGKKGSSGKGGNGKKKKKIRWWQILLITLLVIALIFGGAFALIMGAIAPEGGSIKLNQLINTPKEFQGKEFNILVTGVDRSSTGDLSAGAANDSNVNDGMTDMVLYVHFNNETGEMKMLQIPRDTMVTTDASVSGNFRINGVAKTQGSDGNNNMAALCELIADQYKLPIDGFITIRLEMLTELVDLFGGVEINVPMDVDYAALGLGDSVIHAGYQTLNGASMEFLLRARKIYPDGDIGRLNMQRQFYAALFRKLKSIGNIWDVAKLTPAVLNYMETNLSASDLISFAISMLKIDSSKIMICQMPVISGPQYNGQSLLYPARQADADLLNQYFRENTGPVDASQLNLCDNVIDLSGYTATDPNIQQMGGLMAEADDAQKDPNQNLDGSNQVTDIMASESTAESESTDTDSTDTESQPAA
ncbi:MAG: LCP family protein [Gemmiger formicilis]|uniref:LCP family glycopolymer transferase n=1 Tax=Gemmiger formicilis TaxID=745368 RepID=UPI003FEF8D2A|nr:LCP family protein [Gemmiger formicilis]